MDLLSIARLFGLPTNDAKVRDLLKDLGVSSPPKLKPDDTSVNVERRDSGLFLAFTDEAFFHQKKGVPVGTSPLILTNVTVYCVATPEFMPYKDTLPFKLLPSDGRDAVHRKLGAPELEIEWDNLDRWTIDGKWVFVQHTDDLKAIGNLSLQLPDE